MIPIVILVRIGHPVTNIFQSNPQVFSSSLPLHIHPSTISIPTLIPPQHNKLTIVHSALLLILDARDLVLLLLERRLDGLLLLLLGALDVCCRGVRVWVAEGSVIYTYMLDESWAILLYKQTAQPVTLPFEIGPTTPLTPPRGLTYQ